MQHCVSLGTQKLIVITTTLPTGPTSLFKIMAGHSDWIQINRYFTTAEIKFATTAILMVPFLLIIIIHIQPEFGYCQQTFPAKDTSG